MDKYVSRSYLREKWDSAKHDIEICLDIYNEDLPNKVDTTDVERVKHNIKDKLTSVLVELGIE